MKKVFTIAILLAGSVMAFTQTAPRHIDFTQVLTGLDSRPILNTDAKPPAAFTLGDVAVNALENQIDEDRNLAGSVKFDRDQLARKIYHAKAAILTAEEIALIKERIGKLYGPLIVGAAWPLIDPAMK